MKKNLVNIYMEGDEFNSPRIFWEFGDRCNAYFLIGILEDVKQELIKQIDEGSEEAEG